MLTLHEDELFSFAMAKMIENYADCIVVVDAQNRLAGLLTRGDIKRAAESGNPLDRKLKDICNKNPKCVCCQEKDFVAQAKAVIENSYNINFVLAVDLHNQPVGFVDKEDFQPSTILELEYPTSSHNFPRWISSPHQRLNEILTQYEDTYIEYIEKYTLYKEDLLRIPLKLKNPEIETTSPCYINSFIPPLDSSFLYLMIREFLPRKIIEIGSGHSTKFARQAIVDGAMNCELISIDPQPRVQINAICDKVIRSPLEDVEISLFDELEEGDILFTDNSHRSFMNSDVTIVLTEILPRLKKGVAVHFHDIFLPFDYPFEWRRKFYNEQYLLAAILLNSKELAFDILFPSCFVARHEKTKLMLQQNFPIKSVEIEGGSFWIVKR
jgi:hypothetical protein